LLQRKQMKYQILQGDNRLTLKTLADNSVDAIVTDPPYGIDFLGKSWDANTGALETYQECLRVLKPGGHIVAFSAARTYHHLAITLEQAGFEIRDQIMWIYSSGFPKSQDIGKQLDKKEINNKWAGWGTALKPGHEPIALAQKPFKGNIRDNCQRYGTGALNIDATRVPWGEDENPKAYIEWMKKYPASTGSKAVFNNAHANAKGIEYIKDQDAEINTDRNVDNRMLGRFPSNVIGDIPDYQKYFYCPKVSRKERHIGFDTTEIATNPNGMWDDGVQFQNQQAFSGATEKGNNHPTVKPVELMKYLIKLITPPGGIVLDPFNGSGSTGCAAVELGHTYIGCELDPAYVDISLKRIAAWNKEDTTFNELFD